MIVMTCSIELVRHLLAEQVTGHIVKVEYYTVQNNTDRGAGNDPEVWGLALHHHDPTFINTYCQAATNPADGDRTIWGYNNQAY